MQKLGDGLQGRTRRFVRTWGALKIRGLELSQPGLPWADGCLGDNGASTQYTAE